MVLILSPLTAGSENIKIRVEDDHYITYVFIPPEVTISVGDTVTWKKGLSSTPHSIFGDPTTKDYYGNVCVNGPLNASLPEPGSEFSFTFNTVGNCFYQCLLHPPDMLGVIHVVGPGAPRTSSSLPATVEPQPDSRPNPPETKKSDISGQDGKLFKPPTILEQKPSGQESPAEKTVRANRFELVDGKGNVRAVLAMTPDDEPRLALADRSGQIQVMLSIEPFPGKPDGIPTLRLLDKAGKPRTDISLGSDGNPVITLRNKNGGHLASLSGSDAAEGGAEWLLSDKDGRYRFTLNIDKFGPNLLFLDKDRKARAKFGLKPDGTPVFVFLDVMGEEEAVFDHKGMK
jgi:plastocyanin